MPIGTVSRGRPVEYFMLHDVKPVGRRIGFYAGREIPESVVDESGRRYVYAGVAPRRWNGQFNVDALRTGEFILRPGLVYRLEHMKKSWWESLLHKHQVPEQGGRG